MPSFQMRPILHATDVKFDACKGKNVLCAEPDIDLRRNFAVTFGQTGNISSFMSVGVSLDFLLGPSLKYMLYRWTA